MDTSEFENRNNYDKMEMLNNLDTFIIDINALTTYALL